jgi:subtilisin family serine protease
LELILFAAAGLAGRLTASSPSESGLPAAHHELIVRLAPGSGAPSPEQAVARVGTSDKALAGDLAVGAPRGARFALMHRADTKLSQLLASDPASPRARLERYIVLSYPERADLEAIKAALAASPWVESIEENKPVTFSVIPGDPLFASNGPNGSVRTPDQYQWGSYALNLPAAWNRIQGHAYVGLIDTGLQVDHPDLRPSHVDPTLPTGQNIVFDGGNFRPQFSWNFFRNEANVDEMNGNPYPNEDPNTHALLGYFAGHGTHVSGIVAANPNNSIGVAGACWHCSLAMARSGNTIVSDASAIVWHVDHGAQILSMSFQEPEISAIMLDALAFADQRDVAMFAASGNGRQAIGFPASDSRVVSVGGIDENLSFWEEYTCPYPFSTFECGSNFTINLTDWSKRQELVTPARRVVSTFYLGKEWNTQVGCVDGAGHSGYGLCTGTSMSAPYAAGIGALVRSVNPLLSKTDVRSLLIEHASRATSWEQHMGYGIPDAGASVVAAFGSARGQTLANRLTPLFSLFSWAGLDTMYTTVPQQAAAALSGTLQQLCTRQVNGSCGTPYTPYAPVGPVVPGYPAFPGVYGSPRASVYIFTSEKAPFSGAPPLVPLYRLSYRPTIAISKREITYTTETAGISAFLNIQPVGYQLDGIEGYIFQRCSPEPSCIPAGAVRLYRLYNATRDDFAIFPESELAERQADGYGSSNGLNDWIGYVYPNVDSDGDKMIDGFERLIGTESNRADSDCDGLSDGAEVLGFPSSDPLSSPGCVAGDFNGDGHADLVWRNSSTGVNLVWHVNGTTWLGYEYLPPLADTSWHIEAVADFDGDGNNDIFWRKYPTGENALWKMRGTTLLSSNPIMTVPDPNWSVAGAADFSGDGRPDPVWHHTPSGTGCVWVLGAAGNPAAMLVLPAMTDLSWKLGAVGDYNGDGFPDLAWHNPATGAVKVWAMRGVTYLSSYTVQNGATAPWYLAAVGDYNGDRSLDFVWRNNAAAGNVFWYLGSPAGTVLGTPSFLSSSDPNWQIVGPR